MYTRPVGVNTRSDEPSGRSTKYVRDLSASGRSLSIAAANVMAFARYTSWLKVVAFTLGPSGSSARVVTPILVSPPPADHLGQLHVHVVHGVNGRFHTNRLVEAEELGPALHHLQEAVDDLHHGVDVRDRVTRVHVDHVALADRVVVLIDHGPEPFLQEVQLPDLDVSVVAGVLLQELGRVLV